MGWTKNLTIAALAGVIGYIWTRLLLGDSRPQIAVVTAVKDAPRVRGARPVNATARVRFRAKQGSNVIHQDGCRYLDTSNLGDGFTIFDDAIKAGYRACRICIASN